jgi:threonine synthase
MCLSLRVDGTFDDCQRLVKEAFVDASCAPAPLQFANSINIGRCCRRWSTTPRRASRSSAARRKASYIIPAGNLGNAFAAVWARALGCPIDRIVLAHNANRTVPDFLQTASGGRGRASRRSPRRWTSAIRATWSGCARCIRTRAACANR